MRRFSTVGALATSACLLAGATLTHAQGGFPFGNVKVFSGTVTVEGTATMKEGDATRTITYRASGPVRLVDDAMPNGGHSTWPIANPAAMARGDLSGMLGWTAQVTVRSQSTAPAQNASFPGENVTCTASETVPAKVGLAAPPTGGQYLLGITAPEPQRATCTGMRDGSPVNTTGPLQLSFPNIGFQGRAPGTVGGSKDINEGGWKLHVSYALAPS